MTSRSRRERGVVLALVLILALVLSAAIITFMRRALVDTLTVRNRDAVAEAEALARGGVRLAVAVLLEDFIAQNVQEGRVVQGDTLQDLWARLAQAELTTADGAVLRLRIEDAGARLNLNALVQPQGDDTTPPVDAVEAYFEALLAKVIEEIPLPPAQKLYEPRELAQNLMDWVDEDEVRLQGGSENAFYQDQDPPYSAANRPLLSVEELRLVEGFDEPLVEALRPYVTVYPWTGASGINLNTAPPHVLAAVFFGPQESRRLADEDIVRRILRVRQDGTFVCDQTEADPEGLCVRPIEVGIDAEQFPPVELPSKSQHFRVTSEATVGDVRRVVETVVFRNPEDPEKPRLLSWEVR